MMVAHRRFVIGCASLLLACGGVKTTTGTGCTVNADCHSGQTCSAIGVCICAADASDCSIDGGALDASTAVTLLSIAVAPPNETLSLGSSEQFTATGTFSDGSTQDLTATATWSTSDSTVATVQSGLVQSVAVGSIMLSAAENDITGSVQVTIAAASLAAIAVTPNGQHLPVGDTLQLVATGTNTDGTTQTLTSTAAWTSSNIAVANVSPAGLVTAVGPGLVTITATDGNVSGTAAVTVTPAALSSIVVTPSDPTVVDGQSLQLTATGVYSDGSMMDLTSTGAMWSVDMATVATVSQSGVLSTLMAGTVNVSAAFSGLTGTTQVTVLAAGCLVSISVTPMNPSLPAGDMIAMTATGKYTDGSEMDLTNTVTWSTLAMSVATIGATGELSAVSPGTTAVIAQFGSMQGMQGTTNVTVTAPQLSSVSITPANSTLPIGVSAQMTATGTYTDGSMKNVTSGTAWTSSDTTFATISATGDAHALAVGTTTITATVQGISGNTQLTVGMAAITGLAITPANSIVPLGATSQLTATGTFSDGSMHNVTQMSNWQSSDPSIASITSSGVVTAMVQGMVTISATDGTQMASTPLTVGSAVLASIAVTPSGQSLPLGTSLQLVATGTYTDGSTQDLTSTVVWSASANGVLSVQNGGAQTGLAQAANIGTGTATATVGTISGSVQITVTPPVLASLAINPASASIPAGSTVGLQAIGTFTDGSTRDLTAACTWTTSDNTVAAIAAAGSIAGESAGTATITAADGNFSAMASVSVAALQSIAITPSSGTVPAGTTVQLAATGTYTNGAMLDLTDIVTWTSNPQATATVSSTGLLSGLAQGNVTVTAQDGSISASVQLTVGPPALVSIAVGPTSLGVPVQCSGGMATLDIPETEQMSAEGTYTDGSTQDISTQVTWGSTDPTVATVDSNGYVQSTGIGMVTILAAQGSITGGYNLSVLGPTSITVTGTAQAIPAGTTTVFTATGSYADGSTQFVSLVSAWTTSDANVSTISAPGVALAVGTAGEVATISATLNGVSGSATITVASGTLVSIAVGPAGQTISLGGEVQLTATGSYTDGTMQDLTPTATWNSTAGLVADVDSSGVVTAGTTYTGTPQIVATVGSVAGFTTVTVN